MDLAVAPPAPAAVPRALTEAEIADAIAYNSARFIDPYTISIVRDVVGIPRWPAVSNRDLALAVARWQAVHTLDEDGKVGPHTTRTLVRELVGENQRRLANQLREDNSVGWNTTTGPTWTGCGQFRWNVNFRTTLRGGWLIQRIDNGWNATSCAGANVTPAFTRQYWEAWWVTNAGTVRIPTSTTTPPTHVAPALADDQWFVPPIAGSRGTWSQAGRMYTTLTLPPGFAIGAVPEAMALPSTVGPVPGDDLGLAASSRRVAGRWDCCDPNPANHFHRRA